MGGLEEGGIHAGAACGDFLGIHHDQKVERVPVHQDSYCRRHSFSINKKGNENEECWGEKL